MAEISLRVYTREIDDFVEHEQLDEAIAHCRHILQTHPKHLHTYRLLGKAYLESKRYGDSADLFQRVLSAVPDDFIAHVGMSIVREDEGNLDAAVWHMERAFETNLANPQVQQELRRLIGKRDGLEPHKARLTRGALARMYAQGELFQQAVAELRSALKAEPDRPDLLVLLADMYWRTEERLEAIEVCNRILEKLPYCREANRLMAIAMQTGGKPDEAAFYIRRLVALDPYYAFVENVSANPETVDPGVVKLEKLVWHPGRPLPIGDAAKPEWAAPLGVDLRAKTGEPPAAGPVPSWLTPEETAQAAVAGTEPVEPAEKAPTAEEQPVPSSEVPDWMREAGWAEAKGEVSEAPVTFSDEELSALEHGETPREEGELAPAEIPEWLREIAPTSIGSATPMQEPAAPETGGMEEEGSLPPWLSEIVADVHRVAPEPEAARPLEAGQPSEPLEAEYRIPPSPSIKGAEAWPPTMPGEEPLPPWLEEEAPGATTTIVSWLGSARKPTGELPTDRIRVEEPSPGKPPEVPVSPTKEDETRARMTRVASPEEAGEGKAGIGREEPEREAVSFESLRKAAEAAPEIPEEVAAAEGEAPEEVPEWLSSLPRAGAEAERPAGVGEGLPEWLRSPVDIGQKPEVAPKDEEETYHWLDGFTVEEARAAPEAHPAEAPPGWFAEIPKAAEEVAEAPPPSPEEWQPEREEPLATAPQQPYDSTDWLRGLLEGEPQAAAPIPSAEAEAPDWLAGIAEPERPAGPVEEVPDWLAGIAEPEAPASAAQKAPDWLAGVAEPEVPAEESAGPAPGPTELEAAASAEAPPDWLAGLAEPEAAAAPQPEPPDWLRGLAEAGPEEVAIPSGEETDEWLKDLIAEPEEAPSQAAIAVGKAQAQPWIEPEAGFEMETPDWLRQASEPEPAIPTPALEEAPDWLAEFVDREAEIPEAPAWLSGGEPPWLAEETGAPGEVEAPAAAAAVPPPISFPEEPTQPARKEREEPLEMPDWLTEAAAESPPEPSLFGEFRPEALAEEVSVEELAPAAEPGAAEDAEIFQWLEDLAARQAAEEEVPLTAAEVTPIEEPTAYIPEAGEEAFFETAPAEAESPEWLRELEAEKAGEFEWLAKTAGEFEKEPPAPVGEEEAKVPDWLVSMGAEPFPWGPTEGKEMEPTLEAPLWLEIPEAAPAGIGPEEGAPPAEPVSIEAEAVVPSAGLPLEVGQAEVAQPEAELATPSEGEARAAQVGVEAVAPAAVAEGPAVVEPSAPSFPVEEKLPTPVLMPAPVVTPPIEPKVVAAPTVQPEAVAPPAPQPVLAPKVEVPATEAIRREEAPRVEPTWIRPPAAAPPRIAPAVDFGIPDWLTASSIKGERPSKPPIAGRPLRPGAPPLPREAEALAHAAVERAEAALGATPRRVTPKVADLLNSARSALASGEIDHAVEKYSTLIKRKLELAAVIDDLRGALDRSPRSAPLWQALGDAYMRGNQVADAIEAYRRGMDAA